MEGKFIYCFNEDECEKLLKMGFTFICRSENMGGQIVYIFENHPVRYALFEETDLKQIIVTDQMYF